MEELNLLITMIMSMDINPNSKEALVQQEEMLTKAKEARRKFELLQDETKRAQIALTNAISDRFRR